MGASGMKANIFPNPIADVDTTGASNAGTGTTVSRSTTVGYGLDATSFLASFPGLGTERVRFRVSSLSLTGVARGYSNVIKAIGPIGNQIRVWTRIGYSDASSADSATPTFTLSGGWDELRIPKIISDKAKTISSIDIFVERVTASAWDANLTQITIQEHSRVRLPVPLGRRRRR